MGDRVDLWGGLPDRPKPYFTAQKRNRWADDASPAAKRTRTLHGFSQRQAPRLDTSRATGVPLDLPPVGNRRNWPSGAPGRPVVRRTRGGNPARTGAVVAMLVSLGLAMPAIVSAVRSPSTLDYWKDRFWSPSLGVSVRRNAYVDTGGNPHTALAVSGTIGPASAATLSAAIDSAGLVPGDMVVLSSGGGDLGQATIMGERIRRLDLFTAVGTYAYGSFAPSYCASACVTVFASGLHRFQVAGSRIGVHQFTSPGLQSDDPVGYAQRRSGESMAYFASMGVDPMVVEAGSGSRDVVWLEPAEVTRLRLADLDIPGL